MIDATIDATTAATIARSLERAYKHTPADNRAAYSANLLAQYAVSIAADEISDVPRNIVRDTVAVAHYIASGGRDIFNAISTRNVSARAVVHCDTYEDAQSTAARLVSEGVEDAIVSSPRTGVYEVLFTVLSTLTPCAQSTRAAAQPYACEHCGKIGGH